MYFSPELIRALVLELASSLALNKDSLRNLIYHLKLPGDEVPGFIAGVIAERPQFAAAENPFPARLAFGVVDDCLELFDPGARSAQQTKLCRQVHKIAFGLKRLQQPTSVIELFDSRLALLLFAAAAATDLAHDARLLSNAELAALIEHLLQAMLVQDELTRLLLGRVADQLVHADKERLRHRVRETLEQGRKQLPWPDTVHIYPVDGPVRFSRRLLVDKRFEEAAEELVKCVNRLCH
jgi:hypothetical protein